MFLLEIPTTADFIKYGVILLFVIGFIGYKLYQRQKQKKDEESYFPHKLVSSPVSSSTAQPLENTSAVQKNVSDPVTSVAEILEIPTWAVKMILGIPITKTCGALNVEEAEEAYDDADNGSDEEYAALVRWIDLEEDFDNLRRIEEIVDHTLLKDHLDLRWKAVSSRMQFEKLSEEDLCEKYLDTLPGTEIEKKIVERLLAICKK